MIWTILTWIIFSFNTGSVIWLLFINKKLKSKLLEHQKRLNVSDKDIISLHFNQRVLQSIIKEIRKDLLIYGEIKKSRNKAISFEKQEES
jgi:hypothetical protein